MIRGSGSALESRLGRLHQWSVVNVAPDLTRLQLLEQSGREIGPLQAGPRRELPHSGRSWVIGELLVPF
jgi:hypothetical protein